MRANWYMDPLGRFEGRFFDGENWTEQVSDGGLLSADPDWPPVRARPEAAAPVAEPVVVEAEQLGEPVVAEAVVEAEQLGEPVVVEAEQLGEPVVAEAVVEAEQLGEQAALPAEHVQQRVPAAGAVAAAVLADEAVDTRVAAESVFRSDPVAPAVAPASSKPEHYTSSVSESPTRAVADLNEDRTPAADADATGRRWMYLVGTLALLAGLALLLLPDWFADDDPGDEQDAQSTAIDDGPEGSSPLVEGEPADEPTASVTTSGLQVGAHTLVNGRRTLIELADWHYDYAIDRDIELGADAGCWFGSLGEAALESAYCGPVGTTDTEFVYDLIPVRFTDVGPGQISVAPVTDAAIPDSFLPTGLQLIGPDGLDEGPDAAPSSARGERAPTGD